MIRLENLSKTYHLNGQHKVVAQNINAAFPAQTSVALLGRNGAGKSSLLRMIAGTMTPDSGRVISAGSISWPVGFAGSFHQDLTGVQNVRFIGRIYGVDTDELIDSVRSFAGLGHHFNLPVRSYSSGMRSRLAFGVSMGIDFDTYLVDEVTSVGDAAFKAKSMQVFGERMQGRSAVVVSHSMEMIKSMCQHGAVIENGQLTYYEDIQTAIDHHLAIVRAAQATGVALS
ncbi:ABC transporter ATP-binding protein [Cognatishimia maritima]|uniref:Capsular polysaccharide transport system ATP-binding protein n=1 Tax=Cognatishimia maritima TaxID=870908 RepID=A0A1M5WCH7_9RHOB|nr:ABC transporter ATP-binding protein [Cognatishimia maritima]SHH85206.1 capsular polysaccharide transport system ATP-binding protein [Cognatishimia maritima]